MGLLDFIPVVGNVAQSLIEAGTTRRNVDKTNEANMNLAKYSYSQDLEMWNRQNEYNKPVNQMQRFKDAGLNPNLIYGQGSSGNAVQMPKYNAPTLSYNYRPPVDVANILQTYQDFKMRQAQTDNVKAQTEATRQKTLFEGLYRPDMMFTQIRNTELRNEMQKIMNDIKAKTAEATVKLANTQLRRYDAEADKSMIDVELKNWENAFRQVYGPAWGNAIQALKLIFGK